MFDCTDCPNAYATLRGLQLHRRSHSLRAIHAVSPTTATSPGSGGNDSDLGGHDEYDFSSFRSDGDSASGEGGDGEAIEAEEWSGNGSPGLEVEEEAGDLVSVTFGPDVRSTTPPIGVAPSSDNPCFPFAGPEQHYWAQWASQYNLPATCIDDMCKLQDLRSEGRVFESAKALRKTVDAIPQDVPLRYTTVDVVVQWSRAERETFSRGSKPKKGAKSAQQSAIPACFEGVKSKFSFIPLRTAVRSLASNATFTESTDWTSRHTVNADGHKVLSEPRDGSVWKRLEASIPAGETLAHGILACDKVSRGGFASRKKGYPVYFSLGNIQSEIRNQITSGAMLKIASLPVFEDVTKEVKDHPLFPVFYAKVIFACFKVLLDSLKSIENGAIKVCCGDGRCRRLRLVIGAVLADYPEQCLLSAVYEGRCPICGAHYGKLDQYHWNCRNFPVSLKLRADDSVAGRKLAHQHGYRIQESLFDGYPFHDVHEAMAPDTLHQVKLVFHSDILGNVETEVRALPFGADLWNEVQRRFLLQFPFPGLLFFARATAFANWTGDQCAQCIKIFPGIIAGLGLPAATTTIVKAYAEIFMLARFRRHTNHLPHESPLSKSIPTTLDRLEVAHQAFMDSIECGFAKSRPKGIGNLRRVHAWGHLKLGVERHGSLKGVSTEGPERLHQTAEKAPYNSSSKKRTAESEILLRNEDKHALQALQQRVEAAGVPSMEEMARAAQPGRRRRRGKVQVDPNAGVRTGSDDYRNDAVLTGTPSDIALSLCQPHLTAAISNFTQSSHVFRNNRNLFASPNFQIRTYGLFYTSFVRPDPTRDPTHASETITSCIRARPTWNYSDLDGMVGPRYDFVCIKSQVGGVIRHRIARVKVIFRFHRPALSTPFLLIEWLSLASRIPDTETGWLKYSKTDQAEIVSASSVVSDVALQPVFGRDSHMKRVEIYEQHNEFFLMKAVTDELYDYFHEHQHTFLT